MAEEPGRMQQRRGSDADRRTTTGRAGEIIVTTGSGSTEHLAHYPTVHDGSTAGGKDMSVGNMLPGWQSSSWITTPMSLLAPSSATTTANFVVYYPVCVPAGPLRAFGDIAVNVTGAGGGGESVRLGLYADDDGTPGARVYGSSTISVSTTGYKTTGASFSAPLRPGWYWLAFTTDSATATFSSLNTTGYATLIPWTSTTYKRPTVAYQSRTYADLPDPAAPAGVINGTVPLVYLQHD